MSRKRRNTSPARWRVSGLEGHESPRRPRSPSTSHMVLVVQFDNYVVDRLYTSRFYP
jgi:hypothetical protein